MVAFRIVHQVPGMSLEEAREQHARRVSEMRPRPPLYLGKVGLAESSAHFLFERPRQILLGHLATEAAERAFHQAQIAKFFAELHSIRPIMICNYHIAICYANGSSRITERANIRRDG